MKNIGEINRRDFIKSIPKYFAYGIHSLTEEFCQPLDLMAEGDEAGMMSGHGSRIAEIDRGCCLAWEGGNCQFCYLVCPLRDKAITVEDQRVTIHPLACDGCGKCMTACRTVNTTPAIRMIVSHN